MSRRHTRRWGLYQIGHTSPPPITLGPVINTVSQTAGTIDGGTVITVTGSGFTAGMTTTLGSISNITGSSCTITTSLRITPGAVTWTLTANGISAANQTYTYLGHPSFSSISPSSGPQTLTTSGVTVTVSNLPTTASNCPVTCTIDGNACTAITITSGSTFTCTVPTDTTSGAKNVVVTVDGVSTTGTNAWTYNPPPTDIEATGVGTGGGSGTITGANFVSGATGSVNINGTPTSLTITFVSSTSLTYVLPAGSYTAGKWNLTVTNPDGQSDTDPIFQISSSTAPDVQFGTDLKAWWRSDLNTLTPNTNGALVTSWTDKSGNNNTLTASGSQRPTLTTVDSQFNNLASLTFDGVANTLLNATINTGNTTDFAVFIVVREVSHINNGAYVSLVDHGAVHLLTIQADTSNPSKPVLSATEATVTQAMAVTSGFQVYAIKHNTTGVTFQFSIAVNNGTAGSSTASGGIAAGTQTISIGSHNAGADGFANIKVPEIFVVGRNPSNADLAAVAQYFQLEYQLNPSPSITHGGVSHIDTTGSSGFRIQGSNFVSGCTVTASDPVLGTIVSNVTATLVSSTVIDVPVPSGSYALGNYNVQVTNPDGGTVIASSELTVTATDDPMSIAGIACIGWWESDSGVTLTGGSPNKISAWADKSGLGQTFSQGTDANRPTTTASDAHFNNQRSFTWTAGSSTYLKCTAFSLNGGSTILGFGAVRVTGNAAAGTIWGYSATSNPELRCDTDSKPYVSRGNNQPNVAQWPNSVLNSNIAVYGFVIGSTTTNAWGVNVDNGTEHNFTPSSLALASGSDLALGARPAGTVAISMDGAAFVFFNAKLSASQFTRMQTYLNTKYGV